MKTIKKVLLVDDSEATNHMNKYVIEAAGICEKIDIAKNGQLALEYIESNLKSLPDLIFLDVKMPIMNGFEFLDEIQKYEDYLKGTVVIVMLSSSLSPIDVEKSKEYPYVKEYLNKPLSIEKVKEIFENIHA